MVRKRDYLLGIDLGTTNLKVVLIDREGRVVAQAKAAYPTHTPRPGWSEQDPQVWWEKLCKILPLVMDMGGIRSSAIAAVGLSGQMHGAVFVDGRGKPLRPCITWVDQRSTQEAEELERRVGWDKLKKMVGNRPLPDFTLPKVLWVQKHEPQLFDKMEQLLLPKGYLRFRLTTQFGMETSDASAALLLDIFEWNWAKEILAEFGIPLSKLPPLCQSGDVVGRVTQEAAEETGLAQGTPVIAGAGDQQAGALGGGAITPGIVSATIGTGGQVYTTSDVPVVESQGRVHTFCQCLPNKWHIMGAMKTAGLALQWFQRGVLGEVVAGGTRTSSSDYAMIDQLAEQVEPGSKGLIFLPYLAGERTPHLDPNAKGVFFGLTLEHKLAHMARALLEGVAFAMRDALELLRGMNLPIEEIRLAGGGGASSGLWSQIQADVYGMSVHKTVIKEQSAYGAALLAGIGVGFYDLNRLPQSVFEIKETLSPIEKNVEVYDRMYLRYRNLYRSLKGLFEAPMTSTIEDRIEGGDPDPLRNAET